MATAIELLKKYKNKEKINVLDIRGEIKYNNYHFPNAILVDREALMNNPSDFLEKEQHYYITCNSENSAKVIAHTLKNQGYSIEHIEEGMNPLVNNH